MQLMPYVFFYGRCEEALEFYKQVFSGTYELQRVGDTPMAEHMPPGSGNRVMHSKFSANGVAFMASDGDQTKEIDPDAGNISLALDAPDGREAERVFNALSEGGTVKMPLEAAFWGGRFGMVVDRFRTEWMITTP